MTIEFDRMDRNINETFCLEKLGETTNYISTFEPLNQKSDAKIVIICDSLWDEQERTLLINTKLSRFLAHNGYTVVRFDYSGSGNSQHGNEFITFQTMITDIKLILNWCSINFPKGEIFALVSERISSHIVFAQPKLTSHFQKTIFIHPIWNISHFFRWNFIEREVINHNAYSESNVSAKELIHRLENNTEINLNGYVFNTFFVKELLELKGLWNYDLPVDNCLYIFDEGFYRTKEKWKKRDQKLEMEIASMNLNSRSVWDSEDLKHDTIFCQKLFLVILNYLNTNDSSNI